MSRFSSKLFLIFFYTIFSSACQSSDPELSSVETTSDLPIRLAFLEKRGEIFQPQLFHHGSSRTYAMWREKGSGKGSNLYLASAEKSGKVMADRRLLGRFTRNLGPTENCSWEKVKVCSWSRSK